MKYICEKCKKTFKIMPHLKGTILDQRKVCYFCGHENIKSNSKHKLKFKDAFSMQMKSVGKSANKVIEESLNPVDKIENDLKKALGQYY